MLSGERGKRALGGIGGLLQLRGDQLLLAPAAVLRKLPARFQARDGDLEVDDSIEHAIDVLLAQRVELGQPLLVERGDEAALRSMFFSSTFYQFGCPIGVHSGVV